MSLFFRYSTLILISSILVGCLGNSEVSTTSDESGLVKVEKIGFTIKVPSLWEDLDTANIVTPVNGTLELARKSTKLNGSGFGNNLVIVSDVTSGDTTPSDYMKQSLLLASREFASYTLLSDEEISFENKTKSRMMVFRSQYNEITEEKLFIQTAQVCHSTVYLLTFGLDAKTPAENYGNYKKIFSTFTCL